MDLVQIRYFLALARTLNFTRAAEQCNVTQPALTKSIQRLEGELGGPLLLRERSLTQLTDMGRSMHPLLEHIFLAAERAKEHAASLRRRPTQPLRIGFDPDAAVTPFLPLFTEVADHFPGLQLRLVEGSGPDIVDGLLHGRLDTALLAGEGALVERLNRWALFGECQVVALRPGDPLAAMDTVPGHVLAEQRFIAWAPAPLPSDGGTEAAPAMARDARSAPLPAPTHVAATLEQALHLVRAGFGVTVAASRAVQDPSLVCRPLQPSVEHHVVLAAVAGRPQTAAASSLVKLARARGWEAA